MMSFLSGLLAFPAVWGAAAWSQAAFRGKDVCRIAAHAKGVGPLISIADPPMKAGVGAVGDGACIHPLPLDGESYRMQNGLIKFKINKSNAGFGR